MCNTRYSSKTFSDKIVTYLMFLGLSHKKSASLIRVDPITLGHWERGEPTQCLIIQQNSQGAKFTIKVLVRVLLHYNPIWLTFL